MFKTFSIVECNCTGLFRAVNYVLAA